MFKIMFDTTAKYIRELIKWIFLSVIVGFAGGIIGSIFHLSIDAVSELRTEHPYIIIFLPLGGVVIAALYAICKKYGHMDTNRVLDAVRSEESVPVIMTPLIFISTVITHFLGGSAGREGAALQLGGSIGYNTGRLFKFEKSNMHIMVMSGMAAVFAALFGTPLTAALFALEVTTVGVFHYAAIVPCVISSVVASGIAFEFGISPVRFDLLPIQGLSTELIVKIIFLAVLCAVMGIVFCLAIGKGEHYFKKFVHNNYLRVATGGVIILLLTFLAGCYDYNGAGMDVISRAIGGNANPEAFIIKLIFTAITISAGFKGGEIVPAFFVGSTFGCVIGPLLGLDAGFAASLGFVALFCSVVNCPIASIMLAIEVFGGEAILAFAVVCSVSYMMSGYFGLYKSQKIAYSKLGEEYININTKH